MTEIRIDTPEGVEVGYTLGIPTSEIMRRRGFEHPCGYDRRRLWLSVPVERIRTAYDHGREEREGTLIVKTPRLLLMGSRFDRMAFRLPAAEAENINYLDNHQQLLTLTAEIWARAGVEVSPMDSEDSPTNWLRAFADWRIEEVESTFSPAPALARAYNGIWIFDDWTQVREGKRE